MGPQAASHAMSMSEQADELEERMMHELTDKIAAWKSSRSPGGANR